MAADFSEFFDILPSGHIKISRALTDLDRNLTDPKLEVIATDGGGLSSSVILNLDIVDVNDHSPTFRKIDNNFYIDEVRFGLHRFRTKISSGK